MCLTATALPGPGGAEDKFSFQASVDASPAPFKSAIFIATVITTDSRGKIWKQPYFPVRFSCLK